MWSPWGWRRIARAIPDEFLHHYSGWFSFFPRCGLPCMVALQRNCALRLEVVPEPVEQQRRRLARVVHLELDGAVPDGLDDFVAPD